MLDFKGQFILVLEFEIKIQKYGTNCSNPDT